MKHKIINAGCVNYLTYHDGPELRWDTIFADPPDNLGMKYEAYDDTVPEKVYRSQMREWLIVFIHAAKTVWLSYNARHTSLVGGYVDRLLCFCGPQLEAKNCIQTFTFGQHNSYDLGNNHRPLLRLRWKDAPLYPDSIRVPSWRMRNGDKRADPRGRVPGDVFDFPRVVGNSRQRRKWHPTQLNEGLVERCIRLTTPPGGSVLDPFAGTGTTLRVCKKTGHDCTLIEMDSEYCRRIAEEHNLEVT